jgi:hypothetical protein
MVAPKKLSRKMDLPSGIEPAGMFGSGRYFSKGPINRDRSSDKPAFLLREDGAA